MIVFHYRFYENGNIALLLNFKFNLYIFFIFSNRELILQKVQTMVESGARLDDRKGEEDVREIFFPTIVLFFHAVLDYVQKLNPNFIQGNIAVISSMLSIYYHNYIYVNN